MEISSVPWVEQPSGTSAEVVVPSSRLILRFRLFPLSVPRAFVFRIWLIGWDCFTTALLLDGAPANNGLYLPRRMLLSARVNFALRPFCRNVLGGPATIELCSKTRNSVRQPWKTELPFTRKVFRGAVTKAAKVFSKNMRMQTGYY